MRIGPYTFNNKALVLAPMAGVTDRPLRQLCRDLGTDLAVLSSWLFVEPFLIQPLTMGCWRHDSDRS